MLFALLGTGAPRGARVKRMRVFLALLLLTVLLYNPVLLVAPLVPQTGNDGRAHLARIMCFPWCILWGDVDPRFYFGEAYMLYYGVLFYALVAPIYLAASGLTGAAYAATLAYKTGVVIVDALLAYAVYRLGKLRGLPGLITAILVLMLPPVLYTRLMGAYPFILSTALTLHAVADAMEGRLVRPWLLLSLAILAHPYGVLNALLAIVWLYACGYRLHPLGLLLLAPPLIPLVHGVIALGSRSPPLVELGPVAVVYAVFLLTRRSRSQLDTLSILYELIGLAAGLINTLVLVGAAAPEMARLIAWRFVFVNATVLRYAGRAWSLETRIPRGARLGVLVALLVLLHQSLLLYEPIPDYAALRGERVIATLDISFDYSTPVAWPHAYTYTSATGGFHQGDPLFTNITVYYEWIRSLVEDPRTARNVALIAGAGLIDTPSLAGYPAELCMEARRLLLPPFEVTLARHCIYRVGDSSLVYRVYPLVLDVHGASPLDVARLVRLYGDARIVLVSHQLPTATLTICDHPGCNVTICVSSPCPQGSIDLREALRVLPRGEEMVSPLAASMTRMNPVLPEAGRALAEAVERLEEPLYEPIPSRLEGDKLVFEAARPGWYLVLAARVLVENVKGPVDVVTSSVEGLLLLHVSRPGVVVVDYGVPGRLWAYTAMLVAYPVTLLAFYSSISSFSRRTRKPMDSTLSSSSSRSST
ncbi:hypothetical protein Pyrfu_1113 [Pyrolobus fumarii 1A]|uniref:Uncharacterized protein n=1 Tax=Pyrolobus fumarii (strain DSM 11204 / 1A) TaxID=694429 RepID=G0EFF6_PYRF1|nr:hypothetical protein Pyrfu_1113 [Pyrolobus fumarii 1A]